MTTQRKPDFFIAGAPKSGTTSMQYYLDQHPDIFMMRKELHFFDTDLHYRVEKASLDFYLSFLKDVRHEKMIGEASVMYLYSKAAAENIKKFNPSAKIIIMLRNPVDMVYSLHSQLVYNGDEPYEEFEKALKAEADRKKGENIPEKINTAFEILQYTENGKYTSYVNHYFNVFGRENVHVIIFDDLQKDAQATFQKTLEFLGFDQPFEADFKVVNPNKQTRNKYLRDLLEGRGKTMIKTAKLLVPSRKLRYKVLDSIQKVNTKYEKRPSMDPKVRKRLKRTFKDNVEQLSRLLDRDLTHWTA